MEGVVGGEPWLDRLPIGVLRLSPDGTVLAVNPAFCALCGVTARDLLHARADALFVDAALVTDVLAWTRRNQQVNGVPMTLSLPRNESRAVLVDALPAGEEVCWFVRDVTELRQLKRREQLSRAFMVPLGENLSIQEGVRRTLQCVCEEMGFPLGILWTVDRPREVVRCLELWASPQRDLEVLESILRRAEFPRGGAVPGRAWQSGRPVWISDAGADHSLEEASILERAGLRCAIAVPVSIDGETLGVMELLGRRPAKPDDGLLEMLRAIGRHLGEFIQRRRAEEALLRLNESLERRVRERTESLEELNAELDAFAFMVTHDLRAPLRAMRGFAQALLEDLRLVPTGSGPREFAGRIVEAAGPLDRLIQDLLAYSRLRRSEISLVPLGLDALVRKVIEDMAPDIRATGARLSVDEALPSVSGNEVALKQVLTNLLSNAIKFVAPGVVPRVGLRAERRPSGAVRLWVEDNGIGIPEEYRDRVFRVFERLNRVESYPGSGVGLAIVRRAMERMNGRVGVEPGTDGGSRFWIELPPAEPCLGTGLGPDLAGRKESA